MTVHAFIRKDYERWLTFLNDEVCFSMQARRNASAPGRPALRNVRRGQPQLPFALMRCREENIARPKSKLRPNRACWAIRTGPPARTFLASLTLARSFA